MKRPLVSITIPTRNSAKTLAETLESITKQTYSNIEIIIVDSSSIDSTPEIANNYPAKFIPSDWKLLGSRDVGFKNSTGDYVLLLDSDQILNPQTIERLVKMSNEFDMICLQEVPYKPRTTLEKLFVADREIINRSAKEHLDPIEGVMLARFFKREVLEAAFNNIPIDKLHDVVAHDHAIIYYEAYKISPKVGILEDAVQHKEPSTLRELWAKNYRYGKSTRELLRNNLYTELLTRKTRFRKGNTKNFKGLQSTLLLILKGIPYYIGLYL